MFLLPAEVELRLGARSRVACDPVRELFLGPCVRTSGRRETRWLSSGVCSEKFPVPRDRLLQTFVEREQRFPSEHFTRFRGAQVLMRDFVHGFVVYFRFELGVHCREDALN